jgi:putative nucleotidyltransferase with HDIG domain
MNDLEKSPVDEIAEITVKERFRYATMEQPFIKRLFELALARERKKNPHEGVHPVSMRTGSRDKSAANPTRPKGGIHLKPIELILGEIKLPAFPQVLLELMRVINDPKCSSGDIAEVIRLDMSLASHLLRLVNSAYYNFPFTIDTVDRAVTLIGTKEITTLAFSSSFLNIFEKGDTFFDMEAFWKHSISCSIASRTLAKRAQKGTPERYFVAGLLHDIGRLVLATYTPDLWQEISQQEEGQEALPYDREEALIGFDHGQFGGALLAQWNFPNTLVRAVKYHHSPQWSGEFDEAITVHVADIVVNALGMGWDVWSFVPPLSPEAWERFGPETIDVDDIVGETQEELTKMLSILSGVKEFSSPAGAI